MIGRLYRFIYRRLAPIQFARSIGVRVGKDCRLIDVDFGSEPWLVSLGDHVSATSVSFVTHDGGIWVFRDELPEIDRLAPITVGDNVFLGLRAIILPGVTIGPNVVIGAGSVVSRDIPGNCVAAGMPAKPLGSLEAYRDRILPLAEFTKHLSAAEKRRHYERKYRNAAGDDARSA